MKINIKTLLALPFFVNLFLLIIIGLVAGYSYTFTGHTIWLCSGEDGYKTLFMMTFLSSFTAISLLI